MNGNKSVTVKEYTMSRFTETKPISNCLNLTLSTFNNMHKSYFKNK